MISIFSKVDVKSLGGLGVVVVGCSIELYSARVVDKRMEFWKFEIISCTQIHKDLFMGMKDGQRFIKALQGFGGMDWIGCNVQKVK
ncbi:hypothetical protein K435DRAFT_932631 [Dendrothele bispora CBS 962.96]|uniref:Uncharacterized protein n=1 Tax=Dendrothele bispora (strain CBS 962.96) TaxID=1314807 RepID=A0A4S8L3X0_DENBC|nr:hypothetical protein K435DRAFT_932631 [Dendrothele bispora CBS 962.96]